jgi:hypothetical protein
MNDVGTLATAIHHLNAGWTLPKPLVYTRIFILQIEKKPEPGCPDREVERRPK